MYRNLVNLSRAKVVVYEKVTEEGSLTPTTRSNATGSSGSARLSVV